MKTINHPFPDVELCIPNYSEYMIEVKEKVRNNPLILDRHNYV